jgi:hypothetical protein
MRSTGLFLAALLVLLAPGIVHADLPGRVGPPGPPLRVSPANAASIVIEARDVTEPRLEIPRALLGKVQVAAQEHGPKDPLAAARSPWLLGGFAAMGLVVVTGGKRRRLVLGALAGVLLVCGFFLRAQPEVQASPPAVVARTSKSLPFEKVSIEVVTPTGNETPTIKLIVPRAALR